MWRGIWQREPRVVSLVSHFCSESQNPSMKKTCKNSLWEPAGSADVISLLVLSVDNTGVGKRWGGLESCTATSSLLKEHSVVRRPLVMEDARMMGTVWRTTPTASSIMGSDFSGWAWVSTQPHREQVFLSMVILKDTQGSWVTWCFSFLHPSKCMTQYGLARTWVRRERSGDLYFLNCF